MGETQVKRPKIAICYDFDKTLSPDDMQTFTLIPSFGMEKDAFWHESNVMAREHLMDNNLAWMYQLIRYSKFRGLSLQKQYFHAIGKDVPLYQGVEDWFARINAYGASKGLEVEHYIISSGLKEIIQGSTIAHNFKRIYASSYMYDTADTAVWPAQAINYTNKTQFIFRISKGIFDECDERVNDTMSHDIRHLPYENIVYLGDSATDIPCFRLIKDKGGYPIGVFDPDKGNRDRVYQLYSDKRIKFFAPADYREGGDLDKFLHLIIDEISAREHIKAEQKPLKQSSGRFKAYESLVEMLDKLSDDLTPDELDHLTARAKEMKANIEG